MSLIRRAANELVYRTSDEIREAVPELRRRAAEIMARPLERELPIAVAQAAGVRHPAASEAERAGLVPGARPGVLSGTVRIGRRDSA